MEPVAKMNLTKFLEKSIFTAEDYGFLLRSLGCLCSAVLYLHENKCRHKDIKPDNILVHEGSMLLTDFGIAMDWADGGGETTIGTARAYSHGYAAPEVHLAKPRKRYTDVWSLGCVFLDMIVSRSSYRWRRPLMSRRPWCSAKVPRPENSFSRDTERSPYALASTSPVCRSGSLTFAVFARNTIKFWIG